MIKFLIEKEFKQLLRNSFLPKMILIFPCMIMILMPWAANLEIKNINLNVPAGRKHRRNALKQQGHALYGEYHTGEQHGMIKFLIEKEFKQ